MKSPQVLTVIVASVFAIIAYILSSAILATPIVVACIAFMSALIAPLICGPHSRNLVAASDGVSNDDIKTLYVGNLPYRANETVVRELFSSYGSVHSVRLMKDKHTGKRRGFGFVEMAADDLERAISALNDTEFQQRTLKVREAKERPEKIDAVN